MGQNFQKLSICNIESTLASDVSPYINEVTSIIAKRLQPIIATTDLRILANRAALGEFRNFSCN